MPYLPKHIILKNKEERRILAGHLWVFSNEVREVHGSPAAGDVVELVAASGKSLGVGFYNPKSLIAVRLLSPHVTEINNQFFSDRLKHALALRHKLYPHSDWFRLVHSESDALPGLVVDKFNDILSIQTFSAGMESCLPLICDALDDLLHPAAIVERNESPLRELEGLPQRTSVLRGTVSPVTLVDGDVRYLVDVLEGQKTGFFLDQRENRLRIRRFASGARVLDCFCNDGGFSLHAARAGAERVTAIDTSAEAVRRTESNAAANGLSVECVQGDVFEKLKELGLKGDKFDVVVLDPPSFTKSRKNVTGAKQGYRDLHSRAFSVLKPGGILLTASCSHHIEQSTFLEVIDQAARKGGRSLQILEQSGAAPDHPTLYAMPETAYLKFFVMRVL